MTERAGKVYLVGSGPGDAAYLTVQAQEILAQAEVLVYDALVDSELIDLVPPSCLKLDVGKRGGQPSTPQSEINRLLVEHCQQGKRVIRLKNGDPFIFGRAQSEIGALKQANCEFEIIPGLSSALVAPLMAGIPLTDAQLSNSFTVVTAHDPDKLNWVSLARLDTLVFLMGGRSLPEIVRRLRGHGRSPYTPIAVIRYAGRAQQRVWDGALNTILDQTAGESLSPCVIVVGEVVKLRAYVGEQGGEEKAEGRRQKDNATPPDLSAVEATSPLLHPFTPDSSTPSLPNPSTPLLPLTDKTILVTRAANQSSQFTALLEAQGARVIEMPTLEIVPPSSWKDLDRAIDHIDDFDWLVLTSTNGVDYFFERLEAVTGDRTFSTNIKIAVVGEKTAQRLQTLGIQPDFVPPNFVADSLVANFPEPLGGLRILFPRVASGGREVLVKEFSSQGAKVREVAAYESRCPATIAPIALRSLQNRTLDVITFASSKTVQHFCQLAQQADQDWLEWLEGASIASIGPQTSESCKSLLGRVDVEAVEYTLEGLTQAIVEWVTRPESASAEVLAEVMEVDEIAAPEPEVASAQPDGTIVMEATATAAPETETAALESEIPIVEVSPAKPLVPAADAIVDLEIVSNEATSETGLLSTSELVVTTSETGSVAPELEGVEESDNSLQFCDEEIEQIERVEQLLDGAE